MSIIRCFGVLKELNYADDKFSYVLLFKCKHKEIIYYDFCRGKKEKCFQHLVVCTLAKFVENSSYLKLIKISFSL